MLFSAAAQDDDDFLVSTIKVGQVSLFVEKRWNVNNTHIGAALLRFSAQLHHKYTTKYQERVPWQKGEANEKSVTNDGGDEKEKAALDNGHAIKIKRLLPRK